MKIILLIVAFFYYAFNCILINGIKLKNLLIKKKRKHFSVKLIEIPITTCNNLSYSTKSIPKFIFQTMYGNKLPSSIHKAINSWKKMNPNYTHFYYDDNACREMIIKYFPKKVIRSYDALIPGAYKSDLWRLCALYVFGGVYTDIRTVPLVPLNEIISKRDNLVLVRDLCLSYIWQGFLASRPKNCLLKNMIDEICDMVNLKQYGNNPLDITGPNRFGRILNRYMERFDNFPFKVGKYDGYGIRILSHSIFSQSFVTDGDKKVIKIRCQISEGEFLKISSKEKYTTAWLNERVYDSLS